jgi:hypothetical protein
MCGTHRLHTLKARPLKRTPDWRRRIFGERCRSRGHLGALRRIAGDGAGGAALIGRASPTRRANTEFIRGE